MKVQPISHLVDQIEILYQDDQIVAINKPYGYLTHKTKLAPYAKEIVLQQLRDQIGTKVYPIHRLDRKTTGVLLFGLQPNIHTKVSAFFQAREVSKTYYAIVRGYLNGSGIIDYPLVNEQGKSQEAISHYECVEQVEVPIAQGKFPTSRYSLIKLTPETGRMHQLRRHLSHIFHPIIGDRPHGCSKQNRLFKSTWDYTEMLLHAQQLSLPHPIENKTITITANFHSEFIRISKILGFSKII